MFALDEFFRDLGTWVARSPVALAFLLAALTVILELGLKVNSRRRGPGVSLLTRDDAVLWPSWIVGSGIAGVVYFFVQESAGVDYDVAQKVVQLIACVTFGCLGPPFLVREYGTRDVAVPSGQTPVRELTPWCGIIWPNILGLLVLLFVVYTGLKLPTE